MSMPAFPDPGSIVTREEAVNAVLISIALEETALSHIINAEGEKIQAALEHADMTTVLEVNKSVAVVLEQITDMQLVLTRKLDKLLRYKSADLPDPPAQQRPPCPPPGPARPCR
ncbi:MAG: hypothetical protein LBR72_02545 [Oscillospiraceae bacterium]|jgi:hypothetical protein|nr:hypothetical protein [Oscillospiraceae bacterium]